MRNLNDDIFEYKENDEVDSEKEQIVRYCFTKFNEYAKNPPTFLVEEVIELYKNKYSQTLTYDEAKNKVSINRIKEVIVDEINKQWSEMFLKHKEKINEFVRIDITDVSETKTNTSRQEATPIIDEELYNKAKKVVEQKVK